MGKTQPTEEDWVFGLSKKDTRYRESYYVCRDCGDSSETVATLDHDDSCSVQSPDAVQTPLKEHTEQFIQKLIRDAEAYYETVEYATDVETKFEATDGVRWTDSESTSRFVLGLGRTSPKGKFHLEDSRGIVLKLDLGVRFNSDHTPVSGNIEELHTWEIACKTDTTPFFGDIIAASRDGMWLIMEQCIPVELKRTAEMNNRDILYDRRGTEYVNSLRGALLEGGWVDPDYKNGNVGLTDDGVPVMIDYGTGPRYSPEEAKDAIEQL